ncbi:MAG: hypothetical protein ACYC6N_20695 [Pirellulaceae bacterium]
MADPEDSLEQALAHWQTMAGLQIEFVEALGRYKAEMAKAELVQAVAAGEWAVARMKAQVVQELESSLRRLTRLRHTTARRQERLADQARSAALIRSGEDLTHGQLVRMWGAYTVFERLAPVSVLGKIADTPLHATAKWGSSYVNPRQPQSACPDPPETVENVHALIGWLKRRGFVPRRGTAAYGQVIDAMSAIASVAESQVQSLTAALKDIEQGTYNTWQPVAIAALPDSVDAKKIIKLGAK